MIRIFRHYISRAYLWLVFIEFIIFFAAMYFGSNVRFLAAESWYTQQDMLIASAVFSVVLTLTCSGLGLYRRTLSWEDYNLLARTFVSFLLTLFVIVSIYYFLPTFLIGRSVLLYAIGFAFTGLMLTRFLFYRLVNIENLKKRVLIIGGGKKAHSLISLNESFIYKGFTIAGFIVLPDEESMIEDHLTIPLTNKLSDIVEQHRIDEIVIALDDKRRGMPVDDLLDCKMSGTTIMDTITFYEREKGIISLEDVYPSWLLFCDGFAQGGFRALEKRVFDVISSLILLMVAWPFMVLTALAIWIESGFKDPVLYRQVRVGEGNKRFDVLKFRSMRTDAEKNGAQWAQQQDNRITRVGSIIRKCRIDELPQIFNVIKGEMSFVGPRPERPEFVKGFDERIPYYRERHRVKPGITGWAQLCHPYGADELDTIQKLQYDLYYVKNYSIFLDLSIMLHTMEVVLWGKGAR
ncbi:MAG: TIGR03013 family PEP-CTERM/XrtA system glycosyltransferase [Methylococcaceae bacterium]|nr:TIGR03013 family PEP-CTERM/XrtA system glycosyltransferase [Methylococcaceae bacterium]MDP2393038.1 TIGR03013 family PEP-CTERM/XrtA system glycosyltransferase [Methylococcaceae bacterium]MDP3019182.1 TIGR03013 family PEP-CTERM/XrtA system glycosyltransferase [Methylococcaceae bacterium]MDP3389644.1 TIGR03013 family PEP-CTERM/XrtA system glycosyltransferase [Methylococcaceae bacterium]MDP3933317.1 TIGR03013 family PEP-CTERM/XrtA system glycosyltransferase [Methylococcaceae bacterium]